MKKLLSILASVAAISLMFSGCTTTNTGEDYFGYSPKHKAQEPEVNTIYDNNNTNGDNQGTWQNPLSDNNDNSYSDVGGNYNSYNPMFVPVIVPWWYSYYGWMSYPYYRRPYGSGFYISFGYSPFYDYYNDWYSPWYDYNPYYGYYWPTHNFYGYYDWFRQPLYAYDPGPAVPRKNRDFGPSRDGDVLTNSGSPGEWKMNRTGFSASTGSGYSSGRRTVNNTASGTGYNRNGNVYTTSGSNNNRTGNTNISNGTVTSRNGNSANNSGTGYSRSGNNVSNGSIYKNGTEYVNPANKNSETVNRTNNGVIKGNQPTQRSQGSNNSGSAVKRSLGGNSSVRSNPSYTKPSGGGRSFPSVNRALGGNRSSGGYSAPARSSSGSSGGRSSSGSSGRSSGGGGSNRSGR